VLAFKEGNGVKTNDEKNNLATTLKTTAVEDLKKLVTDCKKGEEPG